MPSPFPGMDPYLESPVHWPDFHDALCAEIRSALNRSLPKPYFAQLAVREQNGVFDDFTEARIVPDVAVTRPVHSSPGSGKSSAAQSEAGQEGSTSGMFELDYDVEEVNFVEIRDGSGAKEAVTIIEVLSPSNNAAGADRENYTDKRKMILGSTTSLVEIDLLRKGSRLWAGFQVDSRIRGFQPPPEYVALVNRSWPRRSRMSYEIFPIPLTSRLPIIRIPLREAEPECPLDLQAVVNETYDRGPYSRSVDYFSEPYPAFSAEQQSWARQILANMR